MGRPRDARRWPALATVLGLVLGVVVGLVAAYSRNILDDVLMRAMDVILAFPQIMLALVAIATRRRQRPG